MTLGHSIVKLSDVAASLAADALWLACPNTKRRVQVVSKLRAADGCPIELCTCADT